MLLYYTRDIESYAESSTWEKRQKRVVETLLRDLGLQMVVITSANILLAIISHSLPLQLQGRLRRGNGYDDHMANVCHKEIVNFGLDKRLFQKAKKNVMGKECLVYKGHR